MFYLSNLCSIKFIEKSLFMKMCFVIENFRQNFTVERHYFQQNNGLLSFEYENVGIVQLYEAYFLIRECSIRISRCYNVIPRTLIVINTEIFVMPVFFLVAIMEMQNGKEGNDETSLQNFSTRIH